MMIDGEEVLPAEMPCPKCLHAYSIGRFTVKDAYYCENCKLSISGYEYHRERKRK